MLKTLDDFLLHATKIVRSDGSQIMNNVLDNYVLALEKSGLADAEAKINSLSEEKKYDFINDLTLTIEQRRLFCDIFNIITFTSEICVYNLEIDRQQDLVRLISFKISRIIEDDANLSLFIEKIDQKLLSGECIQLHDIYMYLIKQVKTKIQADQNLKLAFLEFMVINFSLLKEHEVMCPTEFAEFLEFNDDLIKSGKVTLETTRVIEKLHQFFTQPTKKETFVSFMRPSKLISMWIYKVLPNCDRRGTNAKSFY